MTDTILVTGGTGNIGRNLVAELRDAGADFRVMSRRPAAAAALLPPGTTVVPGDLTDIESLDRALAGVDTVFLLWPFLGSDGIKDVVATIAAHARRVVYVSALHVTDDDPRAAGVWGEVEHAITEAGLDHTFLRASGFATNTLAWAGAVRDHGSVRIPYPMAKRSLIHEGDIAAVAARVLTESGHSGRSYVLTGPAAISQADQVAAIGEAVGRPVDLAAQPPDEARAEMLTWGDAPFVDHALAYWASLETTPEPVTTTVQEILGWPARTFAEWARDHADDFTVLTTAVVADRYVDAFRAGRMDRALRLAAPDVVRVAPLEGGPERRGLDEIMSHSARLNADLEIHAVTVDGPFLEAGGDRFAVRFAFDETHRPTGRRLLATKLSLYTVTAGAISREEVFHLTPPAAPAA